MVCAAAFDARFDLVQRERTLRSKVGQPFVDGPHLEFGVVEAIAQYIAQDVGGITGRVAGQTSQTGLIGFGKCGVFRHGFPHGSGCGCILPLAFGVNLLRHGA